MEASSRGSAKEKLSKFIADLADANPEKRRVAAEVLFTAGCMLGREAVEKWTRDAFFREILLRDSARNAPLDDGADGEARTTVGIAVAPETFTRIQAANGHPRLADMPQDPDALEFELHFSKPVRLDILTTKQPGGEGAIARFLAKFGEGIQQVEYEVLDVDRATQILAERFGVTAIYPATRAGANGTRVNFFLAPTGGGKKILIELVEAAHPLH